MDRDSMHHIASEADARCADDQEQPLEGGMVSHAVRVGDTVRRPLRRWSYAVHDLLNFLSDAGFEAAPRVIGIDDAGREILTWLPGETIRRPWPTEFRAASGLADTSRLLRSYHDVVASYSPPAGAQWWTGRRGLRDGELICHGDLTPWNLVWRNGLVVGVIDWDFAEPASPMFDLAKFAFHATPMRGDSYCQECGLEGPTHRLERFATICDAYGCKDARVLLDAVDDYLVTDVLRMETLGLKGIYPWNEFVSRGLIAEHSQYLRWFRQNRDRLEQA